VMDGFEQEAQEAMDRARRSEFFASMMKESTALPLPHSHLGPDAPVYRDWEVVLAHTAADFDRLLFVARIDQDGREAAFPKEAQAALRYMRALMAMYPNPGSLVPGSLERRGIGLVSAHLESCLNRQTLWDCGYTRFMAAADGKPLAAHYAPEWLVRRGTDDSAKARERSALEQIAAIEVTPQMAKALGDAFKNNATIVDLDPMVVLAWACRPNRRAERKHNSIKPMPWATLFLNSPKVALYLEDQALRQALPPAVWGALLGAVRFNPDDMLPSTAPVANLLRPINSFTTKLMRNSVSYKDWMVRSTALSKKRYSLLAEQPELERELLNNPDFALGRAPRMSRQPWEFIRLYCMGWSDLPPRYWPPGWAPQAKMRPLGKRAGRPPKLVPVVCPMCRCRFDPRYEVLLPDA